MTGMKTAREPLTIAWPARRFSTRERYQIPGRNMNDAVFFRP